MRFPILLNGAMVRVEVSETKELERVLVPVPAVARAGNGEVEDDEC